MNEEEGNMNKSFAQMKDSLIQTPRNNEFGWNNGYDSVKNSSIIINEINKQYDLLKSTSNNRRKKNSEKIIKQERLMKQNAISQLMKKKVQIENLKEFSMITFPMTKEKFDSIPDNLMIRKLVLDNKYEIDPNFEESMEGKSRFKLLKQQKIAIIIGAVLCIVVTIVIGVLLIVIHNTADVQN